MLEYCLKGGGGLKIKKSAVIALSLSILILAGIFLLYSAKPYRCTNFAMGSYIEQTVWGGGADAAAAALSAIEDMEYRLSWRLSGGDIYEINESAGKEPVPVDSETYGILKASLSVCEESGGALDITIAPLSRLWDFDGSPRLPDDSEISPLLRAVDYRGIILQDDGKVLLKDENMALDLGAVGKGAACDAGIEAYKSSGARRAVLSVGGSVGLYGGGIRPWIVGVRDPESQGILGELRLKEGFLSTSGSYEKFFELDGKTYHHILDPKTGYPAESGLLGVTVLSSSGVLSDALSTACFVLGVEESLPLLREFYAEALFVTDESPHRVLITPGLSEKFTLTDGDYVPEVLS